MKKILPFVISILCFASITFSQSDNSELDAYKQFLSQNENLSASSLLNMHDAGYFKKQRSFNSNYLYLDSIEIKYGLTEYEKNLLAQNGFMVTERLAGNSFGQSFTDIYHKDLPVYVSSDAILHAFHVSYDAILKDVELATLITNLEDLLTEMHGSLGALETKYAGTAGIEQNLKDVDLYLSVAIKLLTGNVTPRYAENTAGINNLIAYVESEQLAEIEFFSSVPRKLDFSQFKVRGHYEDEYHPELRRYFKTMIWLGRMELYLIAPQTIENKPTQEDVQRQTINSYILTELMEESNTYGLYTSIDNSIEAFTGEQDNVKVENLLSLKSSMGLSNASDLLDMTTFENFQNTLSREGYAFQRILSQVLMGDPESPESIKPASAFMIFGQRFVIDSYVTGNVVYDKINFEGQAIKRMLPSTLDVLFALGNDAAAQLLEDELEEYHYSPNLAGLRYLIDNHDEEFWNLSIYNSWLDAIRKLNPPADRTNFPEFMQTAAWWQYKMNTQLASWTELRHDNLLYAKQSYTGGATCSYPYSYVEPVPEFFAAMSKLAENSADKINSISFDDMPMQTRVIEYFNNFKTTADTLEVIAQKQLGGTEFTPEEKDFLSRMLSDLPMCGGAYYGWYVKLYYQWDYEAGLLKYDAVVADYHTAPTDAAGNFVGWVKHAGTGMVDMAVITTQLPDGKEVAFIGPVMSYHEYTSTNFQRLADSEWKDQYLYQSTRPEWVNIYLANNSGESLGQGMILLTGIEDEPSDNNGNLPTNYILANNYPNPFNNGTIINYTIPSNLANEIVEVTVYNIMGEKIKTLVKQNMPAGNYMTKWYGRNESGSYISSGVYFYVVKVGSEQFVGKMNLLK